MNEKLKRKREQRMRKLEMEQAAEKEDFERKASKWQMCVCGSLENKAKKECLLLHFSALCMKSYLCDDKNYSLCSPGL